MKLNGIKILIKGNHDYSISDKTWHEIGFISVGDEEFALDNFVSSYLQLEVPKEYYLVLR